MKFITATTPPDSPTVISLETYGTNSVRIVATNGAVRQELGSVDEDGRLHRFRLNRMATPTLGIAIDGSQRWDIL